MGELNLAVFNVRHGRKCQERSWDIGGRKGKGSSGAG
jgi:hypothetical protein